MLASVLDVADRGAASRRGCRRRLDDQIEFERLVGELGAEFGNLHPSEVDRNIEDALGRLVRTLGIDRSALFQVTAIGDFLHTHQWTRPGCAPPMARVSARNSFHGIWRRSRAGELVCFASLDEVPDTVDRDSLRRLGTKSSVTIPLKFGSGIWGALTFGAVREARLWTSAEIHRFRVVALLFANALARKQRRRVPAQDTRRDVKPERAAAPGESVSASRAERP